MKKIITLLIAAFAVSASFAQTTSQEESRRVILGKQKKEGEQTSKKEDKRSAKDIILGRDNDKTSRNDDGVYSSTERQAKIDAINRDYDAKIQSIRNNPNLTAEEKQRIIDRLEKERAKKIKEVNKDYKDKDRDDDDGDDDDKKDKKVKGNNGKKLGWEKGVGNPHRSDSDKKIGKDKRNDDDDDDDKVREQKEKKSKEKEKKSKSKGKKG